LVALAGLKSPLHDTNLR